MGHYIRLIDGSVFDFATLEFNMGIEGLSHALSQINRYTGHTPKPYSVAQHSVVVSRYLDLNPLISMRGLLHDAHEAFIGDMSTPLKRALPPAVRAAFATLADDIDRKIFKAFDLPAELDAESDFVKHADQVALATELRDLLRSPPEDRLGLPPAHHECIRPWPAKRAAREFAARFHMLRDLVRNV